MDRATLAEPHFGSIVAWLWERGYACYLVGDVLLPLSGDWWAAEYDQCVNFEGLPCWYDVACTHDDAVQRQWHFMALDNPALPPEL